MNLEIAKYRINDVAKKDSITESDSDFLATHVEMTQLQLLDTFNVQPVGGKYFSEEKVFEDYVLNPTNKHQLIIVYGESGTGKSHLIRWFNTRLEKSIPDNEVILFIKRSDNTLKGTIKQLLSKPEVQNIENREVYERLVKASIDMPEKQLKSTIYLSFIPIIDNIDDSNFSVQLGGVEKKRFIDYLRSSKVEEQLSRENGPIDRIYSKVAEHTFVDRDVVAEFKKEDFLNEDFNTEMQNSDDIGRGAKRIIMGLNSDDAEENADRYARYLNQFIPEVIQRCAGIEPGDFGEVFKEIRRELYKIGKNLTLFIEDITSFTGVDTALLNSLIEEHTGAYTDICRLSSIVGSTSNYVDTKFLQNHKDRVTKYIYIPRDCFNNAKLFEFFAKYLNTMSIEKKVVDEWADKGARQEDYPLHEKKEGSYWDNTKLPSGQVISLYPFTKKAIINFYQYKLKKDERIPRYLLSMIITPVVTEIMDEIEEFPSKQFNFINHDLQLTMEVTNQIKDPLLADRMIRFLSIWGDGKASAYEEKGETYISGVNSKIFADFNYPALSFGETIIKSSESEDEETTEELIDQPEETIQTKKMKEIGEHLNRWINGEVIDISTSIKSANVIREARDQLSGILETAINWEAEGVPFDMISKIKDSSVKLISMEGIKRGGKGYYALSPTQESRILLTSLCQKILYKKNWNYPNSFIDSYIITTWIEKHKNKIIEAVKYYKPKEEYKYYEPAMCADLIRQILNGEYHDKTFKNLDKAIYKDVVPSNSNNKHTRKWNSVLDSIYQQGKADEIKDTIQQYFNIRQGTTKANVFIVDTKRLENSLKKIRGNRLTVKVEDQQLDDDILGRKRLYQYYNDIFSKIDDVVVEEKNAAINSLQAIEDALGEDIDTEDIKDFCRDIKQFINAVNDVQINVPTVNTDKVLSAPQKIMDGIKNIKDLSRTEDSLDCLLLLSNDPLKSIDPLLLLIDDLKSVLNKASSKIEEKEKQVSESYEESEDNYSELLNMLDEAEALIKGES